MNKKIISINKTIRTSEMWDPLKTSSSTMTTATTILGLLKSLMSSLLKVDKKFILNLRLLIKTKERCSLMPSALKISKIMKT